MNRVLIAYEILIAALLFATVLGFVFIIQGNLTAGFLFSFGPLLPLMLLLVLHERLVLRDEARL